MICIFIKLLVGLGVSMASGEAISKIEFIDQESHKALEQLFENSNPVHKNNLALAIEHKWTCDLFGVRSGMQKLENVELYNLSQKGHSIVNAGSSPLKHFQLQPEEGLAGESGKIRESLRLTPAGNLVSKMTQLQKPSVAVAFAKCVKSL